MGPASISLMRNFNDNAASLSIPNQEKIRRALAPVGTFLQSMDPWSRDYTLDRMGARVGALYDADLCHLQWRSLHSPLAKTRLTRSSFLYHTL